MKPKTTSSKKDKLAKRKSDSGKAILSKSKKIINSKTTPPIAIAQLTVAQQQGWTVTTAQAGQRAQGPLLGQRPAQPTVVQPPVTTAPPPVTTAPPPTSTSVPAPLTGQQKAKAKAQNKGKHALMAFKPGSANTVDLAGLADNAMAVLQLQIANVDLDTATFVASAMQAVGIQQMPIKDFTDAIPRVVAAYEKVRDIGDDEAVNLGQTATGDVEVALAMRTRKLLQDELANLVLKAERVQAAPLHQVQALYGCLDTNRPLADYLKANKIGFVFDSGIGKKQGGGVFEAGDIHFHGQRDLDPRTWLKLAVHEMGHATLQRRMFPGTPSKEFNRGAYADIRAEMRRLEETAAQEGRPVDQSSVAASYQKFQDQIVADGLDKEWAGMTEDGRLLFDAWDVLRQNEAWLQGVDLGPGKDPTQRIWYQKGWFDEFCAENFMLVQTGDIVGHLNDVDANAPDHVKAAWQTAVSVLDKHAREAILGRTAPIY